MMQTIQPVSSDATAAQMPATKGVAGSSAAKPTAANSAPNIMVASGSTNITMINTQVSMMLSSIGGGELQGNQLLRMVIALLILQALLGNDGGNQQAGASALLDMLGQAGASRNAEMTTVQSVTNIVQIEQQSTVLMTSQAALTPTATEGEGEDGGSKIDFSA